MRRPKRRASKVAEPAGFDGYAFTISFKGVLLEGLEVAFIVLTFGANQKHIPLAAAAAAIAVLVVIVAGVAARAPLARVPENTMKFAVGVMLSSLRHVLGRRGRGVELAGRRRRAAGADPGVLIAANAIVWVLRRTVPPAAVGQPAARWAS